MKVKSLSLRHFKKFYDYQLSLVNEKTGNLHDFVCIYGGNGSGKSTILQSIGASLGVATGRLKRPDDLIWPGFEFPLTDHAWGFPSEVIMDVSFAPGELRSTTEFFSKVPDFA